MGRTRLAGLIPAGFGLALGAVLLWPQASCQAASTSPSESPGNDDEKRSGSVATGIWGGEHIHMEVSGSGALVEYDCGHGAISEPLKLDGDGRFQVKGNYVPEHGGPVRDAEAPPSHPASYSGSVRGETMTLTVTLTSNSQNLGTFTLAHGREGELVKCR